MLIDPGHPIARLVREDRRYTLDAYLFLFESLRYAQEKLGMGAEVASETAEYEAEGESGEPDDEPGEGRSAPRHLTGQELCEAIRQFAQDQFGLMSKCVLNSWGVKKTGDFGEIVYNLIKIGEMRKTPADRREDFEDVFDFEEGLVKSFKIKPPRKD